MNKTQSIKKIKESRSLFSDNTLDILRVKGTMPHSLRAYKKEKESIIQLLSIDEEYNLDSINFLKQEIESLSKFPAVIYPMSIVYSIAHFEVFLADVTKTLLSHFWQNLTSKDRSLTYEEIFEWENINDLKRYIIEKEISKISFKSIKERITYLEKSFKLSFSYVRQHGVRKNWNCIEFASLIEAHATRNIILHNNSVVNSFYLHDNPKTEFKTGQKRELSADYVLDVVTLLFRVSQSIAAVALEKVKK